MHKVYLLLRNNRQTGPYSLEELVQYGLKKDDLIWVDGRSASWAYPSEIEALKSYMYPVSNPTQRTEPTPLNEQHRRYLPAEEKQPSPTPEKHIFVSLPYSPNPPAKAANAASTGRSFLYEEPPVREPQPAPAVSEYETSATAIPLQNRYARSLDEVEEANNVRVYPQRTHRRKKPSAKVWSVGVIAIMMVALGLIWAKDTGTKKETPATVSSAPQQTTAAEPQTAANETAASYSSVSANVPASVIAKEKKRNATAHTTYEKTKSRPVPQSGKELKNTLPDMAATGTEKPVATESGHPNETPLTPDDKGAAAAPQKKKNLGDRINDFFGKFKPRKEETTPASEGEQVSATTNAGERKSTHRSDRTPAPANETRNLADMVTVSANEPDNNWMLGIRGLKITVRNRSDEMIKTATVEVAYYSEQNELLQKKQLQFTNIPPKKSVTLAAPDHDMADHTDYRLLSVEE